MYRFNNSACACALLCLANGIFSGASLAEHRDPAPLSDEIVERVVRQRAQPDHAVAAALGRHLAATSALLKRLDESDSDTLTRSSGKPGFAAQRMQLAGQRRELDVLREELRAQFAPARARFVQLGLHDKIKAWDALLLKAEQRFDRVGAALGAVEAGNDRRQRKQALAKARGELAALHDKIREREMAIGNQPMPTFTQQLPLAAQPQKESPTPPQYLLSQRRTPPQNLYAFLGNTLLAQPEPVPAEAASCAYTAADLAATPDVQLTPEIRALAQQLGYAPAKIFKYVANEIKFEPYYGALKGASATLIAKAGGQTDQASLMIALLRASNIPARYVKGTVQVLDASPLGKDGIAPRWVGARSYAAAANILARGLNPAAGQVTDGGAQVIGNQFAHVWVEACVAYGHYRGAKQDNSGQRWIALDPSFKDKTYQDGIATGVDFDYNGYMATRSNTLPHEKYAEQVAAFIKTVAPRFGDNTLADVAYAPKKVPLEIDILPASLPYQVAAFTAWGDGIAVSETAQLPESHRYKFNISVKNSAATELAALTLALPDTALSRITLAFKGASPGDQSTLDAWKNDGNQASALPCTVNVVPTLKVDGVERASGAGAVGLCSIDNQLALSVNLPELISPTVNAVTYTNIGAANYHALQAYAFQGSDQLIAERAAKLLASVKANANPNANQDETEGEFLHVVGLKYMRYISDTIERVGQLDRSSGASGNHLGLAAARSKVQYLFDLPFALTREGFLIDVPGGQSRGADLDSGATVWKTFLLSGYALSAFESYIWQENARLDAVSTVRGIQFARETGIEVLNLTAANWAAESPKFTSNVNPALNYSASHVNSIKTAYIDQGYTLTIPRSLVQYQSWTGAVFVGEKNDIAVNGTARATFAINQYAGGYTTQPSQPATVYYPPPSNVPSVVVTGASPWGPTNSTTFAPGINAYTTYGGDPVNMVTGNLYHTERDVSSKGRGGLPLVFERSYNSRAPKDGPLGFGWTHSFNHYLSFYGVESGVAKVGWVDGAGGEKFFSVAPDGGGGVPVNSTLANEAGIYVQLRRLADGSYTIREKNGLTYTFENVAGTLNQRARLLAIRDRNNNTLSLAYNGSGQLATVTDSLNRSLTLSYVGNRISEVRDWTNRAHQYGYDANGNLNSYRNPLAVAGSQNPVSYSYYTAADGPNLAHAMQQYTLPRGNGMRFEYYANGRVFRHSSVPNGDSMTFSYNDFRRESITVNERGLTRRFFFDAYGNPSQIIEENGAERNYTYDPASPMNRIAKRDPQGLLTQYQYDALGNVTQITQPSGNTVQFSYFNSFNQPGKIKDARGNYALLQYDGNGNPVRQSQLKSGLGAALDPASYTPAAAELVAQRVYTYDTYGNVLSDKRVRNFVAGIGPVVEYGYNDTLNNVVGLNAVTLTRRGDKNGDGVIAAGEFDTASLVYDSLGRLKTGIDASWQTTRFEYDALDRVIKASDALGQLRDYAYDANGNPVSEQLIVSQNGSPSLVDSSSARFDLSDRKESSTDAGGNLTAFQYDAAGNLIQATNPDNYSLRFEYDEVNRAVKAIDRAGHAVARALDLAGRPRRVTDPNGNSTTFDYWDASQDGRLKRATGPSGRFIEYSHDANGNRISVTDNLARLSQTYYDELNRPYRVVGPLESAAHPVTCVQYDNLSRVSALWAGSTTNPAAACDYSGADANLKRQASYLFDDFGRRLKETDALNRIINFAYDIHNNVTQISDAKLQTTELIWDTGHQLKSRTVKAANGSVYRSHGYTRNPLGQVTKVETRDGAGNLITAYAYGYDTAHRLKNLSDARGNKTLSYAWSPGGLLNLMQDRDGHRTDYLYDPVGRLIGIWAPNMVMEIF